MKTTVMIIPHMYLPYVNANILCIRHVIDTLIDYKCDVHVICMKQSEIDPIDENIDGVHVHRIESLEHVIGSHAVKSKNKIEGRIITSVLSRGWLFGSFGYTGAIYSKNAVKSVERIVEEYKITHILSVSWPFSTHILASKIKNSFPDIKWFAYELDPYAYNFTLPDKLITKRKKLEFDVLSLADGIISTCGICEYNAKMNYRLEFMEKTLVTPLPGLIKMHPHEKSILRKKGRINLIYAGGFYGDLRSPKPLIDLMKHLPNDMMTLHIIGGSIPSKLDVSGLDIEQYERCESNVCNACINDADIAVNFDNNIPNQAPSKILTYMSLNMPIVNFFFRDVMLGNEYLSDYIPHLSICNDMVLNKEVVKEFTEFIVSNATKDSTVTNAIPKRLSNEYVCANIAKYVLGDMMK